MANGAPPGGGGTFFFEGFGIKLGGAGAVGVILLILIIPAALTLITSHWIQRTIETTAQAQIAASAALYNARAAATTAALERINRDHDLLDEEHKVLRSLLEHIRCLVVESPAERRFLLRAMMKDPQNAELLCPSR